MGSSSSRGGTPPYLGPYFAAKAAMDALAVSYAAELARWGIETRSSSPARSPAAPTTSRTAAHRRTTGVVEQYETRYAGLLDDLATTMRDIEPPDADVADVAEAIVDVVDAEQGRRPFRVHIDPADDGAEVVFAVGDRVRAEFLRRVGLADLLRPTA